MMEVAKGVGIGLLDKPFDAERENLDNKRMKDAPVYFDSEAVCFFPNTGIYVPGSVQIFCCCVLTYKIVDIQHRHTHHLYSMSQWFPRTILGFVTAFRGRMGLFTPGMGAGSTVSRIITTCRCPFARAAAVEVAAMMVTFGV
jgi:hypothetical protein